MTVCISGFIAAACTGHDTHRACNQIWWL